MVQRPTPRGKAPRAAERSAGVLVQPPGSAPDDNSIVACQNPQCQQMVSQKTLKNFDVLLVDRDDRRKVYVASYTEPQPKKVIVHEYFGIVEGSITQSSAIASSLKRRRTSHSSPPRNKRRTPRPMTPETDDDDDYVSDAEDELDGVMDGQEGEEYYSQPIKVANLQEYFVTAFKMLGQLGCKDIAKAWIKMGHPKKQTTNPYNGGNTKKESLRRFGFEGALRTPDYWPPWEGWRDCKGCRHREPDHIKKPERLILLNHLLHCGHPGFTIEMLEMATAQIEREIPKNFTAKSIRVLRQIYYARREEIKLEEGLIDADTVLSLYMPKQKPKSTAKTQNVPKAIIATPIKDEPSQRVADSKRFAKAPTADMGFGVLTEDEDLVSAQMDIDSAEEAEPAVRESTPASTVSSVASERLRSPLKQEGAQYYGNGVPKTEYPSFVSVQRQQKCHSSFQQKESPWNATAGQFGGLPAEPIPKPFLKRGSTTHRRLPSSNPILLSAGHRASVPYQGEISSRYPSTGNQIRNGVSGPSEHRHMNVAQSTGQQPRTLSNTSAYPLNSTRRSVASKPMSFSGSSSGFAGLPSKDLWQVTRDHSNGQQIGMSGSIYTDNADPDAFLTSCPSDVTSSFGSEHSDKSFESGLQISDLGGSLQPQVQANQQALDAEFRQYYPTYLTSNFSALSFEPGASDHTPLFPTDYSTGVESKFAPYSQEPRYS